ncbi:hypothetical protein [Cellulomonas sp.]|uniref:hypothetical protein n=1 Tax=Cellulomonas sp. TaxID=40001 RepID=UPI0025C0A230|nr:hypothetical protein [Cellulomonas sp.]
MEPRSRVATVATLTLVAAGAVQVFLGLWWWVGNQVWIPQYGDTVEYIAQAQSFALDGYRTLAYPVAIRGAVEIGSVLHVPWTVLLYQMQLAVWVAAAWYLVRTASPHASRTRVLACTAVVVTVPLPLHYAATVLTDSFALSTLVVVACAAARVVARDRLDARTVLVLVLGVAAAVFVRPDRLYVTAAIAVGAGVVALLRTRRRACSRLSRRRALLLTGVVLVGVLVPGQGMTLVNRATQTADLGRSAPSATASLFGRVAGPHVDDIRELVPQEVAVAFPSPGANRWEVADALVEAGGDRYLLAAVRATLDCCARAVVQRSAQDVVHGLGGPYAVALDWVTGSNSSANWDFTRMAQHRPGVTAAVMAWSVPGALVLAFGSVVAVMEVRRRRRDAAVAGVAVVLFGASLVVAAFFGLTTSSVPNPRYTLIAQAVAWALPVAVLLAPPRVELPARDVTRTADDEGPQVTTSG